VDRHFGEAVVSEEQCGPCTVFALYPGIPPTNEEKSRRNLKIAGKYVGEQHLVTFMRAGVCLSVLLRVI
jgi:hypothetical protein